MLSEEEKRELKAMARSVRIREDFELVRKASQRLPDDRLIDAYVAFVTFVHRLRPEPPTEPPFPIYTNIRL